MLVKEILLKKGREVKAVEPCASFEELAKEMKRANIGALVVRTQAGGVAGLVSERELVRALADYGLRALSLTAGHIMRPAVESCAPGDTLRQAARRMTASRERHLPIVWRERLMGIVSLGDVVKHRLDEMELEAGVLRDLAGNAAPANS